LDFRLVVSSLAENRISLFTSNEELMGVSFGVVADAGSTVDLSIGLVHVSEDELISGGAEVTHIPPDDSTIS
jgi:hypothetical protein